MLDYWRRQIELSAGSFRTEVASVEPEDDHVVVSIAITAERDGRPASWRRIVDYRIYGGKIVEASVAEADQDAADAFFANWGLTGQRACRTPLRAVSLVPDLGHRPHMAAGGLAPHMGHEDRIDIKGAAACFAPDYVGESPARPDRRFEDREAVGRPSGPCSPGCRILGPSLLHESLVRVEWRMVDTRGRRQPFRS